MIFYLYIDDILSIYCLAPLDMPPRLARLAASLRSICRLASLDMPPRFARYAACLIP